MVAVGGMGEPEVLTRLHEVMEGIQMGKKKNKDEICETIREINELGPYATVRVKYIGQGKRQYDFEGEVFAATRNTIEFDFPGVGRTVAVKKNRIRSIELLHLISNLPTDYQSIEEVAQRAYQRR